MKTGRKLNCVRLWSTSKPYGLLTSFLAKTRIKVKLKLKLKCGTAGPNEGSASEQSEGNAQKHCMIERKWRNHDKRRIFKNRQIWSRRTERGVRKVFYRAVVLKAAHGCKKGRDSDFQRYI